MPPLRDPSSPPDRECATDGCGIFRIRMKLIDLSEYQRPDWTDLFIDTLHLAIADKITEKPQLLGIVLHNLSVWRRQFPEMKRQVRRWKLIVYTWEFEDIVAFLRDPSPTARELRRFSPFCGLLTAAEIAATYSRAVLDEQRKAS